MDAHREPLDELMARRAGLLGQLGDIATELKHRGFGRTDHVVGELGERLALEVYGGTLETVSAKDIDMIDDRGRRVQVKARELPAGARRPYEFASLAFDLAVCIRFDRATFGIEWARELTRDEFAAIATPYGLKWRASSDRVAANGADVTAAFRDAWGFLSSSPA